LNPGACDGDSCDNCDSCWALEAEQRKALQYSAGEIDSQAAISAVGNVANIKGKAA